MKTPEEELDDFIRSKWGLLAAIAWAKYLELGRGAVVLESTGLVDGGRVDYVSLLQVSSLGLSPKTAAALTLTLAAYNTERSIVVVLKGWRRWPPVMRFYSAEPVPPEAFRLQAQA